MAAGKHHFLRHIFNMPPNCRKQPCKINSQEFVFWALWPIKHPEYSLYLIFTIDYILIKHLNLALKLLISQLMIMTYLICLRCFFFFFFFWQRTEQINRTTDNLLINFCKPRQRWKWLYSKLITQEITQMRR